MSVCKRKKIYIRGQTRNRRKSGGSKKTIKRNSKVQHAKKRRKNVSTINRKSIKVNSRTKNRKPQKILKRKKRKTVSSKPCKRIKKSKNSRKTQRKSNPMKKTTSLAFKKRRKTTKAKLRNQRRNQRKRTVTIRKKKRSHSLKKNTKKLTISSRKKRKPVGKRNTLKFKNLKISLDCFVKKFHTQFNNFENPVLSFIKKSDGIEITVRTAKIAKFVIETGFLFEKFIYFAVPINEIRVKASHVPYTVSNKKIKQTFLANFAETVNEMKRNTIGTYLIENGTMYCTVKLKRTKRYLPTSVNVIDRHGQESKILLGEAPYKINVNDFGRC